MKITIVCTLVLVACGFCFTSAYPNPSSIDKFDSDVSNLEYDDRNSRLRRSYNDGGYYGYYPYYPYYTSYTQPVRRQDTGDDSDLKYEPLLRYSSRQTKRKKLFVPNLWG